MATKLFFFDIETTGLNFWRNGIHQISGAIMISGKIEERFNFKVRPNPKALIEDAALKVAGVTREEIAEYPEMKTVHKELSDIMGKYVDKFDKKDKFFTVGYNNASFDNQFFRAFFKQCDDKYFGSWFWSAPIDVMVMAAHFLMKRRPDMENFQLATVAKELGVEVDETKLHDAEYDIDITVQSYLKILERIKYQHMKTNAGKPKIPIKGKL
jgi:DNA polymerase-3 subunit epsilon